MQCGDQRRRVRIGAEGNGPVDRPRPPETRRRVGEVVDPDGVEGDAVGHEAVGVGEDAGRTADQALPHPEPPGRRHRRQPDEVRAAGQHRSGVGTGQHVDDGLGRGDRDGHLTRGGEVHGQIGGGPDLDAVAAAGEQERCRRVARAGRDAHAVLCAVRQDLSVEVQRPEAFAHAEEALAGPGGQAYGDPRRGPVVTLQVHLAEAGLGRAPGGRAGAPDRGQHPGQGRVDGGPRLWERHGRRTAPGPHAEHQQCREQHHDRDPGAGPPPPTDRGPG